LYFKDSTELKIKDKTLKIEKSFLEMNNIYKKLSNKINNFKS
jgi:hypothetical protein